MFCARLARTFVLAMLLGWFPGIALSATRTALVVKNNTSADAQVFVVLAAMGGACNTNNPPITAAQLRAAGFCDQVVESPAETPYAGKCQFTLAANQSKTFPDIPNTCISGNITFGGYPACPNSSFPTGFTTAEFTLNPSAGAEDVDVSLVNGYNFNVTITMSGGGGWVVSNTNPPQAITEIAPKPLGQNTGNPGVYPQNCTDCIRLVGQPVCPSFTTSPTCQSARICDAQRAFSSSGGTVTITLQPSALAQQAGGCNDLLTLQEQIKAGHQQYNKLTGKNQGGQKQQLKAKIAREQNQLNQAFASCGTCARIAALQSEIAADHAEFNELTAKNQASRRAQLKAQIIAAQNELPPAIAGCPPCQRVTSLQAQIKADHQRYNQLPAKQAGAKQRLQAEIIAKQNELAAIKPACIVSLPAQ